MLCPAASALSLRFARREGARLFPEYSEYFLIWEPAAVAGVTSLPWFRPRRPGPGLSRRKPRARRAAVPSTGPLSKAGFTSRSEIFLMAKKKRASLELERSGEKEENK